ncbi:MAG: LptF/LptG family permease [Actinobacteria bacterium]|nr:LptF/LptG family permease [Actinomycetota bacterium]
MAIAAPPSKIRLFFGGLWPRVPIIHRYIGRELLIVCALSATALTSLTALCGLIKPLRQHGVTAAELLEILLLLFPVFLVFILPFAIMLACCWVYGRLSADHELNACSSSGINIQTLLIVPLVLGVLAMIFSGVLANWVVPNWAMRRFEGLLARHGKDIVYRQLSRRGSFTFGYRQMGRRCVVHADRIYPQQDVLTGVAVALYAKGSNQVEKIIIADRAALHFISSAKDKKNSLPESIAVVLQRATVVELPKYDTYTAVSPVLSGKISGKTRQRFTSMNLGELRAMGRDPELYNSIHDLAQEARRIFIAHEWVKRLYAQLDSRGYFELYGQRRYRFTGRASQAEFSEEGAKNFLVDATIEEYDPTGQLVSRTFTDVDQLDLELVGLPSKNPEDKDTLTAMLVLRNARISGPASSAGSEDVLERTRFAISGLGIPSDIIEQGQNLSLKTIRKADFDKLLPNRFQKISQDIKNLQNKLSKKVSLEIHSRLAMAASCPVLAVLGALLGAIFRKGQFLVAVGLSIGPAVIAVLFIVMGQRMTDSPAFSVGMAVGVAWTGLILLVIANLVLGIKVLRR